MLSKISLEAMRSLFRTEEDLVNAKVEYSALKRIKKKDMPQNLLSIIEDCDLLLG